MINLIAFYKTTQDKR